MANRHHQTILAHIVQKSGKPTHHTFKDSYLGTAHPRYAISVPALRTIAREWMKGNATLSADELASVIDSLIQAPSSTEKTMAGILLDYAGEEQRKFKPDYFIDWLGHVAGWAEVDALCSGKYTVTQLPLRAAAWEKLLKRMAKSKNIHARRASLVMLVSPLRKEEHIRLAETGLANILLLQNEKEILITKAISWLMRSMIKHHREMVSIFLEKHAKTLPAIAVRETRNKLKTGTKAKKSNGGVV